MWIVPKNYRPSSHCALDTVESKEDLSLLGSAIESSVMWRSKPSPVQTWLRRWKRTSWIRALFGRMLKPSQHTSFETALTCYLEGIRASRLVMQATSEVGMTQGICGHTSGASSKQLDLFDASLRMSTDTSPRVSEMCSKTWKALVTEQRLEYSQRKNAEPHTRERESLSWPTPTAHLVKEFASPAEFTRNTPTLTAMVNWPTPTVAEAGKISCRANHGQVGLSNHPAIQGFPTRSKKEKSIGGQPTPFKNKENMKSRGLLNPRWVEQLMGVPIGWTSLGSWGTE